MTKNILITGATDGIGELTARFLAERGHRILLHGRNREKLAAIAAELGGNTETYRADLSSLDDTQALAASITERHDRLDVLINNAGVLKTANTKASSGRDIRFEVNTLAPYPATGNSEHVAKAMQAIKSILNNT